VSGAAPASLSEAQIRERVFGALRKVAPEADPAAVDGSADLRRELDVDSMDFLNFLIGIHAATGIEVPEADASKLRTIDEIVHYLAARLPPGAPNPLR